MHQRERTRSAATNPRVWAANRRFGSRSHQSPEGVSRLDTPVKVFSETELMFAAAGRSLDIGLNMAGWVCTRRRPLVGRLMGMQMQVVVAHFRAGYSPGLTDQVGPQRLPADRAQPQR